MQDSYGSVNTAVLKPLLVGLTGYAQTGKDTIASVLVNKYGFKRVAFADKLKEFTLATDSYIRDLVQMYGWEDAKKDPYVRERLQNVGVAARDVFGEDFWIQQSGIGEYGSFVISDVRFRNESEYVRRRGGIIVRVTRDGVGPVNEHISDQLEGVEHDYIFDNSGSLEDLERNVEQLLWYLS